MKKVIVLGSTGSIGTSALDIIRSNRDDFQLTGLSANSRETELLAQAAEFSVSSLALTGKETSDSRITYHGPEGLLDLIKETDADIVVNGISGAVGLAPSVTALESGMDLALANKETMVMAGRLINSLAEKKGRRILPVDSEHSAIFHLMEGKNPDDIYEYIITASGGPFRGYTSEQLKNVTAEQAMKHPTWDMGYKISIDSASMANKGLEVIECWRLFNIPLDKIKVLVHPQSMVHSLIRTNDLAMYAHISHPDMRLPIQNALYYPDLKPVPSSFLDLAGREMTFFEPDMDNFPMLPLAYRAAESAGAYPIVYNAVNEVAVQALVDEKIGFTEIPEITEQLLSGDWTAEPQSFDEVLAVDTLCRQEAVELIKKRM
ncbi:1-deoxy-D-xylulose-5-phosphate reductoisomerase [Spirochaeta isovalerica]|uniref:1-deoxy-D-xylulose 5-phosphate reductoisomerase n=1 Tax=Spirochaeta isovalerica TaxID=150 RepID=A0A841RG41_9SPIO|nr:1-deoxy-D-xylulose-5-phosphate reductoisomerase [Spirochaeta isovalerica]MBB6481312.1 1-deoxy-D-xylulose-5-phosphate reductoisomerase [Spirochaeta isovalerica]